MRPADAPTTITSWFTSTIVRPCLADTSDDFASSRNDGRGTIVELMTTLAESQFDVLARECRPQLVRYLGRLVGDADAEDVVQIALAKAADALAGFRGEASPRSWLFRIATNAGHDWNRARQARAADPMPAEADDEGTADTWEDASQERRLVREQMSQCVGEVLRRLPEHYQTVLALSDCEEISDRELAAVLGVTMGAAKIRLHRARARLKDELEKECSFYRDANNVLCCDRKEGSCDTRVAGKNSSSDAYRFDEGTRHQVASRTGCGASNDLNQESNMAVETLPTKQKNLIGVGAAIAAGCQPCTSAFVAGARDAGACERGVRFALEIGLRGREAATTAMTSFADATFAHPEIDAAFRAERAHLEALTALAAAMASNTAALVTTRVQAARAQGATDEQIRLAASIGQQARRGAEKASDAALAEALGGPAQAGCCAESPTECASKEPSTCGCTESATTVPSSARDSGCGCSQPAEFETVRIEKTKASCSVCEDYAKKQSAKPIVVMSCEGACLRGEISRQAANHLCHELAPEKTARICLGGAFTKDGGQRALVGKAGRVLALEGCATRCASRMMRGHFPDLAPEIIVTDSLCDFDRSLFGIDCLPPEDLRSLGRTVATRVAAKL
jgi:RNA polymerase sigma factor (sigma-70 family)